MNYTGLFQKLLVQTSGFISTQVITKKWEEKWGLVGVHLQKIVQWGDMNLWTILLQWLVILLGSKQSCMKRQQI